MVSFFFYPLLLLFFRLFLFFLLFFFQIFEQFKLLCNVLDQLLLLFKKIRRTCQFSQMQNNVSLMFINVYTKQDQVTEGYIR